MDSAAVGGWGVVGGTDKRIGDGEESGFVG